MKDHAMTRLIIARHGNTFAAGDVITRVGKRTDLPLVETGKAQARRLGGALHHQGFTPSYAYTSTLQRTIQMVTFLQEETRWSFPTEALTFLDEIDYGEDENQPEAKVLERIGKEAMQAWEEKAIPPSGWRIDVPAIIMGWQQFAKHVLVRHSGETILVVTSNGIARFAPHLTGDMEGFRTQHKLKLNTGAYSVFEYLGDTSAWECHAWNVQP
jgi:2,3-bisphosphoglycerate-dependent phosphoglycerate mutase